MLGLGLGLELGLGLGLGLGLVLGFWLGLVLGFWLGLVLELECSKSVMAVSVRRLFAVSSLFLSTAVSSKKMV